MKKKFSVFLVSVMALLSLLCAACLAGCDGFGVAVKKVSSYEELVKGYSADSYSVKLTQDIDCNFETVTALRLGKNFDGDGHTIKNAVVKAENGCASFFSENTQTIKNVTFENITVQGGGHCDAIVCATGCTEISNVEVKDSKLTITQTVRDARFSCFAGIIYGGIKDVNNNASVKCVVSDCTVKNTELTLSEYAGSKLNQADIYVGGIAGCCAQISGCRVENCNISAESSDMSCTPYVGGVVGTISGNIENTCSVGNTITAKALYYQDNIMHMYSTSEVYCGGIAAKVSPVAVDNFATAAVGSINYCYADGNEITAKSTGNIYMGGLFGYVNKSGVNQCYAKSNKTVADGYKSGNKDDEIKRRIGGLIGSSSGNSISCCFVYNDAGLFEYTFPAFKSNSKAAGLVAGFNDIMVSKCATFNGDEQINAPTQDEFCPAALENADGCFVSGEQFGNACGCETVEENFWESPNSLKSKLGLTSGFWKFDKGVPYLVFS